MEQRQVSIDARRMLSAGYSAINVNFLIWTKIPFSEIFCAVLTQLKHDMRSASLLQQ